MEKYDITKPFLLPVGMYKLNKNPGYSFQLNRLVNMDLGDLDEVRRIGDQITDKKSWKSVLLAVADTEYEKGNIRSAMGFYRMVAFFMDYDDPDNNACWQKAREPVSGLIVVLLDIILYGFGWLINLLYRLKKEKAWISLKPITSGSAAQTLMPWPASCGRLIFVPLQIS